MSVHRLVVCPLDHCKSLAADHHTLRCGIICLPAKPCTVDRICRGLTRRHLCLSADRFRPGDVTFRRILSFSRVAAFRRLSFSGSIFRWILSFFCVAVFRCLSFTNIIFRRILPFFRVTALRYLLLPGVVFRLYRCVPGAVIPGGLRIR